MGFSGRQIATFLILYVAYIAMYLSRKAYSLSKGDYLTSLHLTHNQVGILDSVFLSAYAVSQLTLPAWCLRTLPAMTIFALVFAGVSASMLLPPVYPSYGMLIFTHALNGAAQGIPFVVICDILERTFDRSVLGTVTSVWTSCQNTGGALGLWLAATFVAHGWGSAYHASGCAISFIAAVVTAGLFFLSAIGRGGPTLSTPDGEATQSAAAARSATRTARRKAIHQAAHANDPDARGSDLPECVFAALCDSVAVHTAGEAPPCPSAGTTAISKTGGTATRRGRSSKPSGSASARTQSLVPASAAPSGSPKRPDTDIHYAVPCDSPVPEPEHHVPLIPCSAAGALAMVPGLPRVALSYACIKFARYTVLNWVFFAIRQSGGSNEVATAANMAFDTFGLAGTLSVGVLVDLTVSAVGRKVDGQAAGGAIRPALVTVPIGLAAAAMLFLWSAGAGMGVDGSPLAGWAPVLLGVCGALVACVDSAVPTSSRRAMVDSFVRRVVALPVSQRYAAVGLPRGSVPQAALTEDALLRALGPAASSIANGLASVVVVVSPVVATSLAQVFGWPGVFAGTSMLLALAALLEVPEVVAAFK